ncbi:MAG: efflux RND transporter periplasmic adaptor subunit [Verrucomicrobia bacterium]|nr:efflux RND transporter periplasmic adaptor subunit [Verrucomicrobiota bacterium]
MKKWLITLAVLAVTGYFGWQQWTKWQAQQQSQAKSAARKTTATIEKRDIRFNINAAGEIGPAEQVSVRPEINGRISELPVDIGDQVKKGALLFALDDSDLQIERSQRKTEIEGAKLTLEKSERNHKRAIELFAQNLISQEAHDDARTDFELAKNSLQRLQQTLALVEDKLTKTKINAPFDCTVLTRPVSAGQAVSGTGGMNAGTEVLAIANLTDMIISSHINQADVTRLKDGMEVKVEVEAINGLVLTGRVERIAPQATIKNAIKGFVTHIGLKNAYGKVRPGMTANLTIPLSTADDVASAPLAAIFTEQGERFAYVRKPAVEDEEPQWEKRPVTIGVSDYEFAEVQSGLAVGDTVSLVTPEKSTDAPDAKPKEKVEKKSAKKKDGGNGAAN